MSKYNKQLVAEVEKMFELAVHVSELLAFDPMLREDQNAILESFEECVRKMCGACSVPVKENIVSTDAVEIFEASSDVTKHGQPVLIPTPSNCRSPVGEHGLFRANGIEAFGGADDNSVLLNGDASDIKGKANTSTVGVDSLLSLFDKICAPEQSKIAEEQTREKPKEDGVLFSLEPGEVSIPKEDGPIKLSAQDNSDKHNSILISFEPAETWPPNKNARSQAQAECEPRTERDHLLSNRDVGYLCHLTGAIGDVQLVPSEAGGIEASSKDEAGSQNVGYLIEKELFGEDPVLTSTAIKGDSGKPVRRHNDSGYLTGQELADVGSCLMSATPEEIPVESFSLI